MAGCVYILLCLGDWRGDVRVKFAVVVGDCWPAAVGGLHESRWTPLEVSFAWPVLGLWMNPRYEFVRRETSAFR